MKFPVSAELSIGEHLMTKRGKDMEASGAARRRPQRRPAKTAPSAESLTEELSAVTDSLSLLRLGAALVGPDDGGEGVDGWQLPGGADLAEYALRAGILAPALLPVKSAKSAAGTERSGSNRKLAGRRGGRAS
jgi:hypothetical protein